MDFNFRRREWGRIEKIGRHGDPGGLPGGDDNYTPAFFHKTDGPPGEQVSTVFVGNSGVGVNPRCDTVERHGLPLHMKLKTLAENKPVELQKVGSIFWNEPQGDEQQFINILGGGPGFRVIFVGDIYNERTGWGLVGWSKTLVASSKEDGEGQYRRQQDSRAAK